VKGNFETFTGIPRLRASSSAEAFAEAFTGRLQALAQAHNVLLAQNWAGADLGELAKGQLAPFSPESGDRLIIVGPKVILAPTQVIGLGVVLHELGTNAAKYGALSVASGKVELSWMLHPDRVSLTWAERNGPPVMPPRPTTRLRSARSFISIVRGQVIRRGSRPRVLP